MGLPECAGSGKGGRCQLVESVAVGVTVGVAVGMAVSVAVSVAENVAVGVAESVAVSVAEACQCGAGNHVQTR